MSTSRLYKKAAEKDFHTSVASAADNKSVIFTVSVKYTYDADMEVYLKQIAGKQSLPEGLTLKLAEAQTGKQLVLAINPVENTEFAAIDQTFRNVVGKFSKLTLTSKDTHAIIEAYETYLKRNELESPHSAKKHLTPQVGRSGSAY